MFLAQYFLEDADFQMHFITRIECPIPNCGARLIIGELMHHEDTEPVYMVMLKLA